jgi:hypothetical protein
MTCAAWWVTSETHCERSPVNICLGVCWWHCSFKLAGKHLHAWRPLNSAQPPALHFRFELQSSPKICLAPFCAVGRRACQRQQECARVMGDAAEPRTGPRPASTAGWRNSTSSTTSSSSSTGSSSPSTDGHVRAVRTTWADQRQHESQPHRWMVQAAQLEPATRVHCCPRRCC